MNTAIWIIAVCFAINTVISVGSVIVGWTYTRRFLAGEGE